MTRIPKVWDEVALKEWATPAAGLNVRPTHMTEQEYYALPVWEIKTHPVYVPGHESAGYREMVRKALPQTPIDYAKLKTEADRKDTHMPGGFIPAGMKARAIKGHEFGLGINAEDRTELTQLLRTL